MRHDASRTGSYSEKLIMSAHTRIPHAAWRGVGVTLSNTSSVAGSSPRVVSAAIDGNGFGLDFGEWTAQTHMLRLSHQLSEVV